MKARIPRRWPMLTGAWSQGVLEELLSRVIVAGVDPEDWSAVGPIWNDLQVEYHDPPESSAGAMRADYSRQF